MINVLSDLIQFKYILIVYYIFTIREIPYNCHINSNVAKSF